MRQEEARLTNECNGASAPQKRPPNRRMVTESPKSSGARLHLSDCASEDTVGEHASESRRMQRRVAGNEGENQTCTSQRASWPRCASRSGAMPRSGRHGRAPMLWGPGKLGRLGVLCTHRVWGLAPPAKRISPSQLTPLGGTYKKTGWYLLSRELSRGGKPAKSLIKRV